MKNIVSALLSISALCQASCAVSLDDESDTIRSIDQSILGGVAAPQYREAALIRKDGKLHCSGALVSPDMVLTAGHCIDGFNPDQFTMSFPHHGGITRSATELINIWDMPYPVEFKKNEVALIRLNAEVDLGSYPYPTFSGIALGDQVRSLGMKQDGTAPANQMFLSDPDSIFAHNANYYGTNPFLVESGDSGGPVFTTDTIPGTEPNVIVAVNSGMHFQTGDSYFARIDSQLDLLESYVNAPSCSEHASDTVRLQMHQLKMIEDADIGTAELRYRVTFGGTQSSWSALTKNVPKGLTLPSQFIASSLTQHASSYEGPRSLCIPGKIEVQERNINLIGQWYTSRSVETSMNYCYDLSDDRWELAGKDATQDSARLKDGRFEIHLTYKAVRTEACSKSANGQLVRLKHINTNKCAYNSLPGNGGDVNSWGCWNDPNMMYVLDATPQHGPNAVRVRHVQTNSCWYAGGNNGDKISHWGCWDDPNMVYFVDDIGGGQVRLRHRDSGTCAYGSANNGGELKSWGCWNDPNMRFEILPE